MKIIAPILTMLLLFAGCDAKKEMNTEIECFLPGNFKIIADKDGRIASITEIDSGCVFIDSDGVRHEFSGGWIMPGLCDAHGHLVGLGQTLSQPDFKGLLSPQACIAEAKKYRPNRGIWYYGRGWNHELWTPQVLPSKDILDSAFPDIPVCFRRVDGHAAWVNSKALEIAGIDEQAKNPEGGKIMKDTDGKPTGILIDAAADMVMKYIPEQNQKEIRQSIEIACNSLLMNGVTEIGAIDVKAEELPIYLDYLEQNAPTVRLQVYLSAHDDEHLADSTYWHFKNDNINVRGLKFYADGALGSYGAALLEDYSDMPEHRGVLFFTEEQLYRKASAGFNHGFDIAVHAIGDSANRLTLNVYEKILAECDDENQERPLLRVEHAQLLHPEDIERFAESDIIASMQPVHCTSDGHMAIKRLDSARAKKIGYKWNTLQKSGAKIIAGSDFPIESHNPFTGIDAFVRRVCPGDSEAWFGEERITVEDAVRYYTITPRKYLNINDRGLLKVGYKADLAIIDNDLKNEDKILDTKVLATIVNGKIKFRRKK